MYEPRSPEEREKVKIIAVDMQGMAPIDGVTQLRADITEESTANAIINFFDGQKAQIVVSDGAPDVTGQHDWDAYMQAQLLLSALSIATYILEEGGSFMGKVYRAANTNEVYTQLLRFFKDVCLFKPSACRNSSIEAFVVCRQFTMPEGHVPCNLITEWHNHPDQILKNITGKEPGPFVRLPFVAHECEYDADLSYGLEEDYVYTEAVQKPLTAAYQEVVEKSRTLNMKYKFFVMRHGEENTGKEEIEAGTSSGKEIQDEEKPDQETSKASSPIDTKTTPNDEKEQLKDNSEPNSPTKVEDNRYKP